MQGAAAIWSAYSVHLGYRRQNRCTITQFHFAVAEMMRQVKLLLALLDTKKISAENSLGHYHVRIVCMRVFNSKSVLSQLASFPNFMITV